MKPLTESDIASLWDACGYCGKAAPCGCDPTNSGSAALVERITEYLAVGGMFNPEHMEHDKVRDLLIDCRDAIRAVAASGSPPSPTPLNAKDKQDAERWRMFISKAHAGVTEDGDIWCGFSGGEPDDYTDVLTLKQVETLNNDDPSPRMAKDIVRRLIDDLVGARASSGSTGRGDLTWLAKALDNACYCRTGKDEVCDWCQGAAAIRRFSSAAEPSDKLIRRMVKVLDARNTPKSDDHHDSPEKMGYESFLGETARVLYGIAHSEEV